MKIVILRHGKSLTPPLRKLGASQFSEWVHEYNAAGLCPTSQPTGYAKECADEQTRGQVLPFALQEAKRKT